MRLGAFSVAIALFTEYSRAFIKQLPASPSRRSVLAQEVLSSHWRASVGGDRELITRLEKVASGNLNSRGA